MKSSVAGQLVETPIQLVKHKPEKKQRLLQLEQASQQHGHYVPTPANKSLIVNQQNRADSVVKRINKLGKKSDKLTHGIREHVKLGAKITETLKGKLSMGARILRVGGVKKVFRQIFSGKEGETLLKVCQCYLSTTSGPIAGLLFISTEKIAFCSERLIKFSSPNGKLIRLHYKVVFQLEKIKAINQSENIMKPAQKYVEIVTADEFDFWFMGFLNYQKAYNYLQQAISQASTTEMITQT